MRAIRQDSCLLHGGGPGPFYKPWGRDGFVTGWSFHYDGRPGSAPHRRLTNSCFEAAALYTFALPPHRRSSGGEGCVPFGEAVEGQTPNAVVLYLRKRKIGGDALRQPAFPRSAPPVWRNGREVMLRGSGCLLASRHLDSVVACPGSMLASPWSRGGVPTHRALVTARSHGPSRRCSGVILLHSRS